MGANITIETEKISDAIFVPQRAVLQRGNEKYVRVPKLDGTFDEKTVVVGIRGDGGRVQITSGLVGGEEIIQTIK